MSYHKKLETLPRLQGVGSTTGGDFMPDLTRQDRWHKKHLRTVSSKLTIQQYQRFQGICQLAGLTPYAALRLMIRNVDVEILDSFIRNA